MSNIFDVLNNEYVSLGVAMFIVLYGLSLARMELPPYIKNLFSNTIFRIVFLSFLLIHNFKKAPHVAIGVALIFVLTLEQLNVNEVKENFAYLESFRASNEKRNY